jgi:hypothetical protein
MAEFLACSPGRYVQRAERAVCVPCSQNLIPIQADIPGVSPSAVKNGITFAQEPEKDTQHINTAPSVRASLSLASARERQLLFIHIAHVVLLCACTMGCQQKEERPFKRHWIALFVRGRPSVESAIAARRNPFGAIPPLIYGRKMINSTERALLHARLFVCVCVVLLLWPWMRLALFLKRAAT